MWGGTNLPQYSSQHPPFRSRQRRSFLHLGWDVSAEDHRVWVFLAVLCVFEVSPRHSEELTKSEQLLPTISQRYLPEGFHVGGRGICETSVSIWLTSNKVLTESFPHFQRPVGAHDLATHVQLQPPKMRPGSKGRGVKGVHMILGTFPECSPHVCRASAQRRSCGLVTAPCLGP